MICMPASTNRQFPVTPRPRSLARNTAVSATSAGSVLRRIGARVWIVSRIVEKSLTARAEAVLMGPAEIVASRPERGEAEAEPTAAEWRLVERAAGALTPAAPRWRHPRTPDGHPDIQGIWKKHPCAVR